MPSHSSLLNSSQTTSCGRSIDDEVRERASLALRQAGYLRLRRIEVSMHEGLATLKGQVTTYHLKQVAQCAVLSVDGVGGVENHIVVCPNGGIDRTHFESSEKPFRENHKRE